MRTTVGLRFLYRFMKYTKHPIDLPQQPKVELETVQLIYFHIFFKKRSEESEDIHYRHQETSFQPLVFQCV